MEPKTEPFFFYSFGVDGLKSFIIQDNKKIVEKILFRTEQLTRTDNKITQSFGNKLKLRDFINIWMVEDKVQDVDSVTCGIFQMYFYHNLFNPDQNNKIQKQKTT